VVDEGQLTLGEGALHVELDEPGEGFSRAVGGGDGRPDGGGDTVGGAAEGGGEDVALAAIEAVDGRGRGQARGIGDVLDADIGVAPLVEQLDRLLQQQFVFEGQRDLRGRGCAAPGAGGRQYTV